VRLRAAFVLLVLSLLTLVWPLGSQERRAVVWTRAQEAASGGYRTVTDASGLVEVDSEWPLEVDHNDLVAVCRAKAEALRRARVRAEQDSRGGGIDEDPTSVARRSRAYLRLASVATFQGDLDTAIVHLTRARRDLAEFLADFPETGTLHQSLTESLGAAHMRRGEVQNCMLDPNAERCLFPVLAGGRHQQTAGASAAATHFLEFLQSDPGDLEVKWLLNVAHMLLGTYPGAVPKEHLLAPGLFASEHALPQFVDVAGAAALGRTDIAGGTITDDFDGDGLLDVFLTSVDKCTPARLYRNTGTGTFDEKTDAGLDGQYGAINSIQADYDNDGRMDVYLLRGGWEFPIRNSLLRNLGGGRFEDVTARAGLIGAPHLSHSAAFLDYDLDGHVDLFIGHEMSRSQLFRNRGDGTFEDVTARAGVASFAVTKGVTAGDYDGNGYPDLYLSNMFNDNFLFRNNGDGTFPEAGGAAGVAAPRLSFPTWFFDFDNDGRLDIFVASYPNSIAEFVKYYLKQPPSAETLKLYRNRGDGTFADVSAEANLARIVPAMGSNFGDLDNDGYLDMYLGTGTPSFAALVPNIMLRNDLGRRFQDVTAATGTGHLQKGHGVAFADLDNDGDEDVVINLGGAVPGDNYADALFENPGAGKGHNWISLRLVGAQSNRAAIGARIRVTLRGKVEGSNIRYREVSSGGSFGNNSLMQHIGLGPAAVESIEITWPRRGAKPQVLRDVPVNAFLEVTEGNAGFVVRKPQTFTLGAGARGPGHRHGP
jgi:hypothetical protein